MKQLRNFAAVLAVTVLVSPAAFARLIQAPEVDPSMGAGALAFVAGAILVIRGRRKA